MPNLVVAVALLVAVANQRSFVDTAPLSEGSQDEVASAQDSSVKELENLKHSLGKTLEIMKSQSAHYSDVNGKKEGQSTTKSQVNENGKLVARIGQHVYSDSTGPDGKPTTKVRTDVEIPSKGIHKSVVQQLPEGYQALTENGNRRSGNLADVPLESQNSVDKMDNFATVQYSPLDMAEYVFWTGDEKGVSMAIEEFLQEGMMSREEAISFLQEIKYNLEYLKAHYNQLGLNSRDRSKDLDITAKQTSGFDKSRLSYDRPELRSNFDINQLRQEANKKRSSEPAARTQQIPVLQSRQTGVQDKLQDEEYDELLERLRVADFLYTEYSLEEVIYQLAKVMFTQSLTRGSADAQKALQKFTNFLEMEAEQGHISRALEKKVLDVLIAALSDTLTEHPELITSNRDPVPVPEGQQQHFIRQILELSPEEKLAMRDSFPYQPQTRTSQLQDQIKNGKLAEHAPLGLGKYKSP